VSTCIRCGGQDAPSETVMCPGCFVEHAAATACPPLPWWTVEKFKAFFARPATNRVRLCTVAARTRMDPTRANMDILLAELGTVRRWNDTAHPYTVTVWMNWHPRVTWADVRELREVLRDILPVFVRARIMAVPRRRA